MKSRLFTVFIVIFLLAFMTPTLAEEAIPIEDIERAGTYLVEVVSIDEQGNRHIIVVRMTIRFPRTVINLENQEGIDAHDIVIERNKVQYLDSLDLIQSAGAHAWSLIDGRSVAITTITLQEVRAAGIDYTVTFATALGTAITINIFEVDEIVLGLANNFVNFDEVQFMGFQNITDISIVIGVLILLPVLIITYLYINNKRRMEAERKLLHLNVK
jgi:hypothetical protein